MRRATSMMFASIGSGCERGRHREEGQNQCSCELSNVSFHSNRGGHVSTECAGIWITRLLQFLHPDDCRSHWVPPSLDRAVPNARICRRRSLPAPVQLS